MYVSHLKLTNWKNFVDVDVPLQRRMFIVGPNASGKSNLLDAFRFLHDITKQGGGLQKAISDRGGLSKIRSLAARRNPKVVLDVVLTDDRKDEWRYRLSIKQEQRGNHRPLVDAEQVYKNNKVILSRPTIEEKKPEDSELLTQTHLEQIVANKEFRVISDFFADMTYFHLIPQLVKYPQAFTGPGLTEDPFGKKFLEKIANSTKTQRESRLGKIRKALTIAIPQLEQLEYKIDDKGVPHLEGKYHHWRPQGAKQNEREFSDGTLRLIALLWSLLDTKGFLLLEEPELSLHSAIVMQLAVVIARLQKIYNKQVLLSTHSYELLSDKGIGLDEIILLNPEKEKTDIFIASSQYDAKKLLGNSLNPSDIVIPPTRPSNINQLSFL